LQLFHFLLRSGLRSRQCQTSIHPLMLQGDPARSGQKPAACARNGKNQPLTSERSNSTAAEETGRCRTRIVGRELEKTDITAREKPNAIQVGFFCNVCSLSLFAALHQPTAGSGGEDAGGWMCDSSTGGIQPQHRSQLHASHCCEMPGPFPIAV